MPDNYWNTPWNFTGISSQTAVQIALQHVPGHVVKVELDTEDGRLIYEVHIRTPYAIYEVEIDANSGAVLKIDSDID
ncbi:MAG: PepSY domain-containing protein [Deltaproteobacteria bacterium]